MRAHFDVPATPDTPDNDLSKQIGESQHNNEGSNQISNQLDSEDMLLKSRIMEFKSDSEKMAVVGEFIEEVLQTAEEEANKQQNSKDKSQQVKNKSQKQNFKNGKVVNRARGFVVRLFESICNCANNAAAAPVTRFKLRSGKRANSNAAEPATDGDDNKTDKKEDKSKSKQNGKEKKNDKAKINGNGDDVKEAIELEEKQ